ncbi:MAG: hypothetical protein ABI639_02970 [Thermoanaerobaculia bacterium]
MPVHPLRLSILLFVLCSTLSLRSARAGSGGDGTLDPAWGGDGISGGFTNTVPRSAFVSHDQQLYFTGRTTLPDETEMEWWRTQNSGDDSWYGCTYGLPFLDHFDIRATLVDVSGHLLFAGTVTVFGSESVERAFVARFTQTEVCSLDSAFSGDGWEIFDDTTFCDDEDCRLIDIEASNDSSTRYVALLESVQNALISKYYLVGLTQSGALDPNFGSGGFAPVTAANLGLLGGGSGELGIDRSNRPYVLLSFYDPLADFDLDTALTRFQSDGDLDTTFGVSGSYFVHNGDTVDTVPLALTVGSDGRLALTYRLLDTTFSGLVVFDASMNLLRSTTSTPIESRALAFDGLGRLLVANDRLGQDGFLVTRYAKDSSGAFALDATFGSGGNVQVDIDGGGANNEVPIDLQLVAGRPMVLVDANQDGGGSQAFLVRLETHLIFADSFDWGTTRYWTN